MGSAAAVAALWTDVRELSLGTSPTIDELHSPPSPLVFLREYVSANKPCVVRGGASHWPAVAKSLWSTDSYLSAAVGADRLVSVHLTPDGRADALTPFPGDPSRHCFASAFVRRMPMAAALRLIQDPSFPCVPYLQEQNDCFRTEYGGSALASDVDSEVPWATAALGCPPEAVNLWVGDSRSQTSFHKDHYENLYAVVEGEKHFLLLPPTDFHRLYVRNYPAARYVGDELRLELEEPSREVPWCSVDPYPKSEEEAARMREEMPLYFQGPRPFRCTVKPGDILYL